MEVKGKVKLFATQHESSTGTWYSYRTSVGNKKDDGTWDNDPYEVVFAKDAKGAVLPNGSVIDITDGFLSCRSYTDKNGEKRIVSQIVVMAFDMGSVQVGGFGGGFTALQENDVPF